MTNRVQLGVLAAALAVAAATSSLRRGSQPSKEQAGELATFAASAAVDNRLAELRTRFQIVPAAGAAAQAEPGRPTSTPRPVIARGVDTRFQRVGEGRVRAVVPEAARRGVRKRAHVELPLSADGVVRVTDDKSGVPVGFRMRGARPARLTATDEGIALYPGAAPEGGDVVHRVHAEGTEDFVAFETKPEREALEYEVDVSHVPGLRLVGNVLEFLEANGTPALRVAPPYVVGKDGVATAATIRVQGCAYDENTAGPWNRAVTAPGSARCDVRVEWHGVTYPALVDPSWVATGSMVTGRYSHTATLLSSGDVLIAGGTGSYPSNTVFSSAELFDGTSTFAATGSMAAGHSGHTATLLNSGKVLIAGGTGGSPLSSAELFDGISSFATTGSMAAGRYSHAATLLNTGKVLVTGGVGASGALSSAELFDGTSSFTTTGSMAAARYRHTATLLNSGKVLIAGSGGPLSSAELFDGTSSFAATGSMTTARANHTATLLNSGEVLVAGGGVTVSSAELFDGTSTFFATGSMTTGRASHTATLLNSGRVLLAGGVGFLSVLSTAELFDGTSNFAGTGSMTTRATHTATLLNSGKVLVAGGAASPSLPIALANAQLFDLLAVGETCGGNDDCVSGICNERCCSGACGEACTRCDGSGACVAVTSADDPDSCTGTMTCSATGACGLKNGELSATGSNCVSGAASDGVCCNAACTDPCDVCTALLGASSNGTCTITPRGNPGNPSCAKGILCNGTQTTCQASCASDADCGGSDYCAADSACHAQKVQAAPCDALAGADCQVTGCRVCTTGQCVDGFCCDTACTGAAYKCQACSAALKQSGTGDGSCGPAKVSTNPHNDACPTSDPSTCGASGQCDGNGGCQTYYPAGTSCGVSQCAFTGNMVQGQVCNGGGLCQQSAGTVCDPYVCAGGSCPTTCAVDNDCVATAYCTTAGTCVARQADGSSCTAANQCANNHCVDGVCCDQACSGQCQACDLASSPGSCSPVVGAPHGIRAACSGPGTDAGSSSACGGTCDGVNMAACTYPGGTITCDSTCSGSTITPSTCNGQGACVTGSATPCSGNLACAADNATCKTACTADADCAVGFGCASGACTPKAARCLDSQTSQNSASGSAEVSCAPYKCDQSSGECLKQCASATDCVSPNACNADGECVAGGSAKSHDSGGCAVATTGASRVDHRWILALGLLAARRRRRHGTSILRTNT